MGLFGAPSPCESEVEKATNVNNISEEWGYILEVCDKAGKSPQEAKDYLKAILKRLNNPDPHISLQAVTLLDACVKNCGKTFHIELASRDFESEYLKLINKSHTKVIQKLKESLKKWAEGEFKTDQQLSLIPSLYATLKNKGTDFHVEDNPKRTVVLSKDPNVVQSQEEEDQIAKAIMLSLKESSGSPRKAATTSQNTSLYPSTNVATASTAAPIAVAAPIKETRKVRALYDFEAAEDNELTFQSGEIIFVIDDSDPNWWKGSNQRGEGLFPANFVTVDLTVDADLKKKKVVIDESLDKKNGEDVKETIENVEINEGKIDRLLHLLHEADPTNPEQDTNEMIGLEREVNSMGPLIDNELERVDRKHAQLTQLSSDLVEALSLYHTLMREPQFPVPVSKMPYGYQPQPSQAPHSMVFNGTMHHQPPASMGGPPNSMMGYNTLPHDRSYIPSHGGNMGGNMPNHFTSLPPQGLPPPGHMPPGGPPPGSMPPPMSAPPHSMPHPHNMAPQSMPPHMQQDDRASGSFLPQGFGPGSCIPLSGFPGQHVSPISIQNGPQSLQNNAYSMPPQASNTHM